MKKFFCLSIVIFFILSQSFNVFSMETVYDINDIVKREINITEKVDGFITISDNHLYIPDFNETYTGIKVNKYSLFSSELIEEININTDKLLAPFVNPIIYIKNNNLYFLDYANKEIKQFDFITNDIKCININNEYAEEAAPAYKSSFFIKDDYIYIINPFLYEKNNPIQKYDFNGNLLKEYNILGPIVDLQLKDQYIYYISFNKLYKCNDKLKIMDTYELNEDKYNYSSSFAFFKEYFVGMGEKYLTFYNLKDDLTIKYSLNELTDEIKYNFMVLSDSDRLYLVDIDKNIIYQLVL